MSNYKSYVKKLPLGLLREAQLTKPNRQSELFALYHIMSTVALYHHIKGSIYFTEDEQRVHDADIYAKRNATDGIDHMPHVSTMVNFTVDKCLRVLDRCEAVCVYRDLLGIDPVPPRYYRNMFEE